MSRPSVSSAPRNLSLTEELEKLEQSITLTLQEIDHNFSRAHRIVTTSILPVVEQYGEHSRSVWEASKFWKQFFEASANVSLSGYEELTNDEDTTTAEETTMQDETTADYAPRRPNSRGDDDTVVTSTSGEHTTTYHGAEDSLLDDGEGDLTGSTPRPPATKSLSLKHHQFANLGSPYEDLKRRMQREEDNVGGGEDVSFAESESGLLDDDDDNDDDDDEAASELLQQRTARLPDLSMTPRARPLADSPSVASLQQSLARRGTKDPLLHRVLDRTYRVQATPHRTPGARSPVKAKGKGKGKEREREKLPAWQESSPMSSPEMAVPQLRSEAFMSPVRSAYPNRLAAGGAPGAPRTPGVSVQTPATGRKTKDIFASEGKTGEGSKEREKDEITWESDSDEDDGGLYGGMSPPKTIHFALPPSKLMQTPARDASRRIVDDILLTAGVAPDESSEYSPTMVKMSENFLDDTF